MKFDTIIIGGGLSGLVCGIRLIEQGQRCAIISSGQSALHFSSGSFDLLNTLPDGRTVAEPTRAVKELISLSPAHPYSKLGSAAFGELASKAESFFSKIGIDMIGSAKTNHYRITPMGILKPAWLTMSNFAVSDSDQCLPWKKVSIFNASGFLDFYPRFIAHEFSKIGVQSDIHLFNHLELENLPYSPSNLRSASINHLSDRERKIDQLAAIIQKESRDSDVVLLPDIIGLKDIKSHSCLQEKLDKPIFLLATLPPSATGTYMQKRFRDYFIQLGGTFMLGDRIQNVSFQGDKVSHVYSYNHGDIPFVGENFVLATGSFFSQGLIATENNVSEPIFDLDVNYATDRKEWYDPNLFEKQNYQEFGVKTNASFQGIRKGKVIENLFVSGALLEGFNPIKEGSGAGVSILSALYVADAIVNKQIMQ